MGPILQRLLVALLVEAALWLPLAFSTLPESWLPVVIVLSVGVAVGAVLGLGLQLRRWRRSGRKSSVSPWRRYLIPRELPPPPAQLVGRADLLVDVKQAVDRRSRLAFRPLVINIYGPAGTGKSAFVLHAATVLIERFPDGVVYSSLTGAQADSQRVGNVAGDLVDSLQGPGESVPPTPRGRFKELRRLSRRWPRVLYVFDDAQSMRVIRPLLPVAFRSVVLVSSIEKLRGLRRRAKIICFTPKPLNEDDASGLLAALLGQPTLDEASRDALGEVARAAHRFPLALHLAARAINSRGVSALTEIEKQLKRLRGGQVITSEGEAIQLMLELNVEVLNARQQRLFLTLGSLPPDMQTFVPWMAGTLVNADPESDRFSDEDVWTICERLADQRLLERVSADATGVLRFQVPDRIQKFLAGKARASGLRPEQVRNRLDEEARKRVARTTAPEAAGHRDATIHLHLLQGKLSEAVDEARGALADVREAEDWQRKQSKSRPDRSGLMSADERGAMAVLAEVLAELGGLDDAVEIAGKDRHLRKIRRDSSEPPPDLAAARSARMLGRLHRRQLKIGDAVKELNQALEITSKLGSEGLEEAIVTYRELAAAYSTPGVPESEPVRRFWSFPAKPVGAEEKNAADLTKAYGAIATATKALEDIADESLRGRLQCRLWEGEAVVKVHHVEYHGGGPLLLDQAYDLLDRAIAGLDSEFKLWHAWFRFHQARIVRKQADAILAAGGDVDASLQRMAVARRIAEDAVRCFSEMKHRYGTARCRLEIGQMYAVDRPTVAIPMLEDARETFIFCGDRWIEARTALSLAEARFRLNPESDAGHDEFTFALRVFTALDDKASLRDVERISASLSSRS